MTRPLARLFSRSNFAATGMVVTAGAIAWFGLDVQSSKPADLGVSDAVTLAAGALPTETEEQVFATVSIGGLPTRIVIPTAEVDASIVEVGVVVRDGEPAWETAWQAAGHHMDSALPGQPGNMVISGHVSVANRNALAVFKHLDQVVEGDTVDVFSGADLYRYTVTGVMVVSPDAVNLLKSNAGSTVTLITCTKDLKERLVVIGTLSEVVAVTAEA
jgi:LPXTG-site transpeptidase (sortase) family protein